MYPVDHIGQPVDVAALAIFLASDVADFINGAEVGLDGGIRARLHDPLWEIIVYDISIQRDSLRFSNAFVLCAHK